MFDLGVFMELFSDKIYESIMHNDETWYVTGNGNAMIINDCQLLDC